MSADDANALAPGRACAVGKDWHIEIVPGAIDEIFLPDPHPVNGVTTVAVSYVNRIGQEGPIAVYEVSNR